MLRLHQPGCLGASPVFVLLKLQPIQETRTFANHLVVGAAVSPGQAVLRAVAGIVLISDFSASVLGALPAAG